MRPQAAVTGSVQLQAAVTGSVQLRDKPLRPGCGSTGDITGRARLCDTRRDFFREPFRLLGIQRDRRQPNGLADHAGFLKRHRPDAARVDAARVEAVEQEHIED
jgi:hypothetical protein